MKSIYYNGEKKAHYTSDSLKWLSDTDKEIFEPMFEHNQGIVQEEDSNGNVIFKARPLSTTEKISILLDVGFTLDKGKTIQKKQKVKEFPEKTATDLVMNEFEKEYNEMIKEAVNKIVK